MAVSSEKTSATLRPTAPHSPGLGMTCLPRVGPASHPYRDWHFKLDHHTPPPPGLSLPMPLLTSSPHWMLPESLPQPPQPQLCCVFSPPSPPLEARACVLSGVACSVDRCDFAQGQRNTACNLTPRALCTCWFGGEFSGGFFGFS